MAEFDESLYAHVSVEEVDSFLSDHAIDKSTLQLANSFAMAAILGPAGSTIAEDLILEAFSEFIFKDVVESNNFLLNLERRFLAWQPTPIPTEIQDRIIADLEKNRTLAEAKAVLVSASQFVQQNTEPLLISKVRNSFVSDIIAELSRAGIITERHLSNDTVTALDSHLKLEVRHLLGLLKAICSRMKGDDIFGGRIPEGWNKMLSEQVAQRTSQLLRARKDSVVETLLALVNNINQPDPALELQPQRSLLFAIRQLEGENWDGIGPELRMEHIGHVLLLAESLN
jgi:E3 ubiquitin-protein ligase RNF213